MKKEIMLISKSPMTRSMENLKDVKYIILHQAKNIKYNAYKERKYIDGLKNQDEIYYSVHYIIDLNGDILNIVPENEVTWSTFKFDVDYNAISIECCFENEDGSFNKETTKSLKKLIILLCKKYNLKMKENIFLHYDITGTRCPIFYVDNPFYFKEIIS